MKNLNKEKQNYFNHFGILDVLVETSYDIDLAYQAIENPTKNIQKKYQEYLKEYYNNQKLLKSEKEAYNYIKKLGEFETFLEKLI